MKDIFGCNCFEKCVLSIVTDIKFHVTRQKFRIKKTIVHTCWWCLKHGYFSTIFTPLWSAGTCWIQQHLWSNSWSNKALTVSCVGLHFLNSLVIAWCRRLFIAAKTKLFHSEKLLHNVYEYFRNWKNCKILWDKLYCE